MKLFAEFERNILLNKQVDQILGVSDLVLEANVANIKQNIGSDLSIHSYLMSYASQIPEEYRASFVKKLTQLLINDNRFLYAMREVPQGAPEWVSKAVADGQLMVFTPNPELSDKMTHMVHFIAAADHDSKQTENNDQRVFAQRELAGFGKAETLDLLIKKSNEYFARGSRSAKRDESGMSPVFKAADGYVWWNLDEPAAFQREGKTLQNCIGSVYTAERCKQDKTSIIILRDPKGNTVAAARLKNLGSKQYEVQELKGKQNKPPIDEYMPPVIELIDKMGIKIASHAVHDFDRAGYIFYQEKLYPVEEAIQKFTHVKEIAPMSHGNKLVEVFAEIEGLLSRLYPGAYYHGQSNNSYRVPESRTANNEPLISFIVKENEIFKILSHKSGKPKQVTEDKEDVVNSEMSNSTRSLVQEMYKLLKAQNPKLRFNAGVIRKLNWVHNLITTDTDDVKDLVPDEQIDQEDKGKWDVFTNPQSVHGVSSAFDTIDDDASNRVLPSDIEQVYRYRTDGTIMTAFGVTKKKQIVPFKVNLDSGGKAGTPYGFDYDHDYGAPKSRNLQMLKTMIDIANEKGLTIPRSTRQTHLIIHNKDGKYERFKPQPKILSTHPKALMYDLTQYPPQTREDVFSHINKDIDYDPRPETERGAYRHRSGTFSGGRSGELITPDSIVFLDASYGVEKAHTIVMAIKGNTVEHLDDSSKEATWQAWDDYKVVADQVNKFAADHKLTISPKVGTRSKEFTVIGGKLATKTDDILRKAEKRAERGPREGTNEIKFANGTVLKVMAPQEQASLMRKDMKSSTQRGDLWVSSMPKFGMFVSNGNIQRIVNMSDPGELSYGVPGAHIIPLIKAAADTFGWKNRSVDLSVKKDTEEAKWLQQIADRGEQGRSMSGNSDIIRSLVRKGLVKVDTQDRYNTRVKITQAGINAGTSLRNGSFVDALNGASAAPLHDSFVKPDTSKPVAKPNNIPGAPRPPSAPLQGGGTKADLAVAKFREMLTANGTIPSASQFIPVLMAEPFNMSKLGAQTYYYNTKKKVGTQVVGEHSHLMAAFLTPGMTVLREFQEIV